MGKIWRSVRMKLTLAYYGEPILRKKTVPVLELSEEIRQLVADMVETMQACNGVGLAAPQVHRSLSIFVTCVPKKQLDGKWIPGQLRVFINPKILSVTKETEVHSEGCLSIPKIYGEVERPSKVTVRATDLNGNIFEEEFSGLEACCVLHENDHINGVLFVDRIFGKARKELEPKLRTIKKNFSQ
jgi:peptide deformylase